MRAAILSLILLTGLLAGPPARAEETPPPACDVPGSLLNSDSTLAKVAAIGYTEVVVTADLAGRQREALLGVLDQSLL